MNYSDNRNNHQRDDLLGFASELHETLSHKRENGQAKIIVPISSGQGKWLAYDGDDESFIELIQNSASPYVFVEEVVRSSIDIQFAEMNAMLPDGEASDDTIEMLAVYVELGNVMVGKSYCTDRFAFICEAFKDAINDGSFDNLESFDDVDSFDDFEHQQESH